MVVLAMVLVAACGVDNAGPPAQQSPAVSEVAGALTQPLRVELAVAGELTLPMIALASATGLEIGKDAVAVGALSAAGGVVRLDDQSDTGSVVALGDVSLGKKARVRGDVTATGSVSRANHSVIDGRTLERQSLSARTIAWTATVPAVEGGNITLVPRQVRDLVPGSYGTLAVPATATLVLHSGVYAFTDIEWLNGSTVLVDDEDGPVQVYATDSVYLRATIQSASTGAPNLLIAYLGEEPTVLRPPFEAMFVAPNADVELATCRDDGRDDSCSCDDSKHGGKHGCRHGHGLGLGHRDSNRGNGRENRGAKRSCEGAAFRGVVYASHLTVDDGVRVEPRAFDWVSVVGSSASPSTEGQFPVHTMPASELADFRVRQSSADSTPPSTSSAQITLVNPLRFRLHDEYPVSAGIIANGTVRFTYENERGASVVCTYQGKSPSPTPQTPVDLNLGRMLRFVSCSDGSRASALRASRRFELAVQGVPNYPVSVGPPTKEDGGCSEDLELISLDEMRRLRDGFDWRQQAKVEETNGPAPALYYAWIYVRNATEATALRKLYIHTLRRPLFTDELQRFAGRCGTFVNPGDGEGVFVPAIIPGATYNKLIEVLTAPRLSGDKTIFEVVRLRALPPGQRNPNGSLRADQLANSGFYYLDYESKPLGSPDEYIREAGATRVITDATVWVANAAKTIVEQVQVYYASIAALFAGRVGMTLDLHSIVRTPEFVGTQGSAGYSPDPVMVRGWGRWAGRPMGALGMKVSIVQGLFSSPLPVISQGRTNRDGTAVIDAIRDSDPYKSGLCMTLRTKAADVTDLLLPSEVCDFRGFGVDPNLPNNNASFQLRDFSRSQRVHIHIDNIRLNGLYQADDVWLWSHDIAGFDPPRARVVSGFFPGTFSPDASSNDPAVEKRLAAPCLGQTRYSDAIAAANLSQGFLSPNGSLPGFPFPILAASVFTSVLFNTDIFMPVNSSLRASRVVMRHEYGHHVLCSMLDEFSNATDDPVGHLAFQTVGAGRDFSQSAQYVSEGFAEFIAGQVVGGADYSWAGGLAGIVGGPDFGRYCARSADAQCFDRNLSGRSTSETDTRSMGRMATLLHDAFDGSGNRFGPVPGDADLWERTVNGPLTLSQTSFAGADSYMSSGSTISRERVSMPGSALKQFAFRLAEGMGPFGTGPGITDTNTYKALDYAMERQGVHWCDRCRVFALHTPVSGATPNVLNLLDACRDDVLLRSVLPAPPDPDYRLNADTCLPCPPSFVPNNDGGCQLCPAPNTIVGNKCELCAADVVRDGATLVDEDLNAGFSIAGDRCPGIFILEVQNPPAIFLRRLADLTVELEPAVVSDSSQCSRLFSLTVDRGTPEAPLESVGNFSSMPGIGGTLCSNTPTRIFYEADLAGVTRLRLSTPTDARTVMKLSSAAVNPK